MVKVYIAKDCAPSKVLRKRIIDKKLSHIFRVVDIAEYAQEAMSNEVKATPCIMWEHTAPEYGLPEKEDFKLNVELATQGKS